MPCCSLEKYFDWFIGQIQPCNGDQNKLSFKLLKEDDGRRSIAIGHQSDWGDLTNISGRKNKRFPLADYVPIKVFLDMSIDDSLRGQQTYTYKKKFDTDTLDLGGTGPASATLLVHFLGQGQEKNSQGQLLVL